MAYVIDPPALVTLPVAGSEDVFPVRRVYCVGRNYADHAIEMGHDPTREEPFFFQKNPDNLLLDADFPYPSKTSDVHFEAELVVALRSGGTDIPVEKAMDHVFGYAIGVDMTRRDLQAIAKKAGRPWITGKACEHSAPISRIVPAGQCGNIEAARIWLEQNGTMRQDSNTSKLTWKLAEIISYLSGLFELKGGDLIMTGTPEGVGPVQRGDKIRTGVDGVAEITFNVV